MRGIIERCGTYGGGGGDGGRVARMNNTKVENPCTFDDVRSVIEDAFGRPLEELFSRFDEEPIGRASIGQAHLARLAETDEEVRACVRRAACLRALACLLATWPTVGRCCA